MFLSVVRASLARPCMFEIPRWGTFDRASYVVLGLRSAKGGCRRAWRAILTLRERTNVPDVYPFFRNPICSRPATNGLSVPARSLVKPECPSTRAPLQGRGVPPSFLSAARRHQPREASHVRDFDVPRWGTFDRTPYTFLAYRWRRSGSLFFQNSIFSRPATSSPSVRVRLPLDDEGRVDRAPWDSIPATTPLSPSSQLQTQGQACSCRPCCPSRDVAKSCA